MYSIAINDAQSRLTLDLDRLRDVAEDLLRHEQITSAEVSFALIDGATMRQLNREHLGHDFDTDVLSFLLDADDAAEQRTDGLRAAGKSLDGEVLISTDVAAKAAVEFGWSAESEVLLYLVHGLLHLAGYDDLTDDERLLMRDRERVHLARWGLEPRFAPTDESGVPASPSTAAPTRSPSGVRD